MSRCTINDFERMIEIMKCQLIEDCEQKCWDECGESC